MVLLVTTCGGRDPRHLGRLMRRVDASGWKGRRLVISDGRPSLISAWPTSATPQREGQKRAYWRALAAGLEEARKAKTDRILILEDDVDLCTNALEYMERARLPREVDFVTWFDGHAIPPRSRQGIYPVLAQSFFCLQGVTWWPSTAETLLASPMTGAWKELHSGDILIAKILRGRHYGVHVPNLVQHLGDQSICNPGQGLSGVRVANNYPGARFDALTLGRSAPASAAAASRPGLMPLR
jgi:hypothetical protein